MRLSTKFDQMNRRDGAVGDGRESLKNYVPYLVPRTTRSRRCIRLRNRRLAAPGAPLPWKQTTDLGSDARNIQCSKIGNIPEVTQFI